MINSRIVVYVSQLLCAVLGKAAFLGVTILLYKALSLADAAAFALCYATATVLATISECGMRGLMVREMSRLTDEPHKATHLLAGTVSARLWTFFPYLIVGAAIGAAVVPTEHFFTLALLLLTVWLDSNSQVIRGALRAFNHIILDAAVGTIARIALLVITGILFAQSTLNLYLFAQIWAAIALCDLALSWYIVAWRTRIPIRLNSTGTYTLSLIKRAAPFTILAILSSFYLRAGTLILGMSKTPEALSETAGFSLSGRIPEGVAFVPIAFMNASIPFIARNSKNKSLLEPLFRRLELVVGSAGIIVGVGMVVFSDNLILMLATPEYLQFNRVFKIYGAIVFFSFTQYIYSNLLLCLDQEAKVAARHAYMLIANVILNLMLIWEFGAVGAAISLLLCEMGAVAIDLYYLRKAQINTPKVVLLTWAGVAAISVIIAAVSRSVNASYGLWYYLAFGGLLGLLLLILAENLKSGNRTVA